MKKRISLLIVIGAMTAVAGTAQAGTRFAVRAAAGTADKMVVTDTGAIGVGVTVPTGGVHIKSGTFPYNIFKAEGNESSGGAGFIAYHVKSNGNPPEEGDRLGYMLFGSVDNWGNYLHSSGISAKADEDWTTTSMPTAFILETSGATGGRVERMRISSNGYVGIGTQTPYYHLDVNGTIRGNTITASDIRLKENIEPLESALDKVKNLRGVSYNWKKTDDKNFPEGRHYGVIAQEIEKVLPEVVSTAPDGTKSVAYMGVIPVLIEAIKEQQKRIEALEKKLSNGH